MHSTYCDEHDVNRLNEKQLLQAKHKKKQRARETETETIIPINHIKLTYQAKIDRKEAMRDVLLATKN